MTAPVEGLVGVYDADGGLAGEVRYVVGHLLGRTECALCDVTHSPVRRRRSWDEMVERLGLPFALVHRNEVPPDVAGVAARTGLPCVVARGTDGAVTVVLTPADLAGASGSVARTEELLRAALSS